MVIYFLQPVWDASNFYSNFFHLFLHLFASLSVGRSHNYRIQSLARIQDLMLSS